MSAEPLIGLRAVVGDLIERVAEYSFFAPETLEYPAALDREVDAILAAGQFEQQKRRIRELEADAVATATHCPKALHHRVKRIRKGSKIIDWTEDTEDQEGYPVIEPDTLTSDSCVACGWDFTESGLLAALRSGGA